MAVAPTSNSDPRVPQPQPSSGGKKTTTKSSGKSNATSTTPGDVGTAAWFAQELLKRIGAPVSDNNIHSLVSWMAAEGGHWNNSAQYNPLNTTLHVSRATRAR
jgi:hypothetical protein